MLLLDHAHESFDTTRSIAVPTSMHWSASDETILYVAFEGNWVIEEFIDVVNKVSALIDAKAPKPVSIILNMEKSGGIPRGGNVLPHFRNAMTKLKFQYMIIAGGTSFG